MCLIGTALARDTDLAKMLVGKWEITKTAEGRRLDAREFTKDGTVKVKGKMGEKDFVMEGKYKVETHKFTCTFKDGDKEKVMVHDDVKITDKEMSFKSDDGKVIELKKKS